MDQLELKGAYTKSALEGTTNINKLSGEVFGPNDSRVKVAALSKILPEWEEQLTKDEQVARYYGVVRDNALFFAFALMSLSKLSSIL